jgi:ribosomal protein L7/L12
MTAMQTVLGFNDFFIIGMIVLCFAGAAYVKSPDVNLQLLTLQVRELQKKLDALLKHQGVEMPSPAQSGLSPEVELLASVPDTRIAAIKLYRKENRGTGLREAKEKIEAFYKSRQ